MTLMGNRPITCTPEISCSAVTMKGHSVFEDEGRHGQRCQWLRAQGARRDNRRNPHS